MYVFIEVSPMQYNLVRKCPSSWTFAHSYVLIYLYSKIIAENAFAWINLQAVRSNLTYLLHQASLETSITSRI